MHQVLFTIPILKEWFPPDGIPVYGFGAMLFITFIVCTAWGVRRAKVVGMSPERFQDLTIWLFVSGIVGARVLYMVQYANQFPDKSLGALVVAFFQIWKGGIIFYGSALGGAIGYGFFYWFVLRRLKVSGWQLADAVAPLLALGLAIGRIGCYLNGCCWGQVAIEEACPVPLGGAHFPLLPAHAREQLVRDQALQTSTGFTVESRGRGLRGADPRTVVQAVEPGSAAAAAGLKKGDRIVEVNGQPNVVVEVLETGATADKAVEELRKLEKHGVRVETGAPDRTARAFFNAYDTYEQAVLAVRSAVPEVRLIETDLLGEMVRDWPRGKHALTLTVQRDGEKVDLASFVPRTVGLYPTQLYETISMVLLIFLLIAYYPFRHHDGELMVLCMIGYAVHRFVNESLRIEPTVGMGLTLSQWGSVVIFVAAVGMEVYLWRVMPSRWRATPDGAPAGGKK
ncbi:MAG: lgt [Gemmataceae bacterium]|nr:lgt [Gemmataceae bacterium]